MIFTNFPELAILWDVPTSNSDRNHHQLWLVRDTFTIQLLEVEQPKLYLAQRRYNESMVRYGKVLWAIQRHTPKSGPSVKSFRHFGETLGPCPFRCVSCMWILRDLRFTPGEKKTKKTRRGFEQKHFLSWRIFVRKKIGVVKSRDPPTIGRSSQDHLPVMVFVASSRPSRPSSDG